MSIPGTVFKINAIMDVTMKVIERQKMNIAALENELLDFCDLLD